MHGVTGLADEAVLPTIGSKELVALLPTLLRIGPGDRVVLPEVCYPTYEVGVRLAGAEPVRADSTVARRPGPGPAGLAQLAGQPDRPGAAGRRTCARSSTGPASAARWWPATSATCDFGWEAEPVSVLHPSVTGGDHTGVLAVHSLSKRSNLAGYRAGFVAGDPALVAELLEVAQARRADRAGAGAGGRHGRVRRRRARGRAARPGTRPARALLRPALEKAGFTVEHSEAGLYLWATRGRGLLGRRSTGWPSSASSSRRAPSTARPASGTCGSRSPRPTSGSRAAAERLGA